MAFVFLCRSDRQLRLFVSPRRGLAPKVGIRLRPLHLFPPACLGPASLPVWRRPSLYQVCNFPKKSLVLKLKWTNHSSGCANIKWKALKVFNNNRANLACFLVETHYRYLGCLFMHRHCHGGLLGSTKAVLISNEKLYKLRIFGIRKIWKIKTHNRHPGVLMPTIQGFKL